MKTIKPNFNALSTKLSGILAMLIIFAMAVACSFSTANLSEIKFDKDKSASSPKTKFNPEDEVFAITEVNNAGGTNKVKFRLLFDDVEGAKSGTVAYKVEKEVKTEGSQKVWLNFGVPSGFVPGSYKVEAVLTDESGKELDRKTGIFTVGGGSSTKTTKTTKTTKPKKDSSEENIEEETETKEDSSEDK